MKKFLLMILSVVIVGGCDNFLDTKDYLNKNTENFPVTAADLESMLTAVYQSMAMEEFGGYFLATIASDEAFGGGGPDDFMSTALDLHKKHNENMLSTAWGNYYTGIYRANDLLENIDKVENISESVKNRITAEAYFMRALFHFNLVRLFGEIPIFTKAEQVIKEKSVAKDVYAQIGEDLKRALELFPDVKYTSLPVSRLGHANKWVAEGFLARVFLFYTGYYQQETLPVIEGEGFTKEKVIAYLEDCINNSGHELAKDFRTLWPYTNKCTVEDYLYTKGQNLKWLSEEGDNKETVFAIKFGNKGAYGNSFRNTINVAFAIRGQSDPKNCFPFGAGWGQGSVNSRYIEQWENEEPNDPRIMMSVLNVDNPEEGIVKYEDNGWNQIHDTHLWNKKYTVIMAWKVKGESVYNTYTTPLYGSIDAQYERESQDIVLLRFSDILLMHSELTETNTGLNKVRQRVGLSAIPYSFEALQNERKHELFYEGVRYYDLLRWYGKEAGVILQQNQNGVEVINSGANAVMEFDIANRIKATGGFWPIPLTEISLSNGVLLQSEGWETNDSNL